MVEMVFQAMKREAAEADMAAEDRAASRAMRRVSWRQESPAIVVLQLPQCQLYVCVHGQHHAAGLCVGALEQKLHSASCAPPVRASLQTYLAARLISPRLKARRTCWPCFPTCAFPISQCICHSLHVSQLRARRMC
jgi:hypothetical protein